MQEVESQHLQRAISTVETLMFKKPNSIVIITAEKDQDQVD
jgi:hypothetical protein